LFTKKYFAEINNKLMYISIIIPTYRNWDLLIKCINALDSQSFSKDKFEVVIINNDPEDTLPSDLKLPPNFIFIEEKKPGSYAARNAGLRIAKGEIIGFTDSDCIPDKDWIKNAVDYLKENPDCSRIAGNILVSKKATKLSVIETYNQIYAFPQEAVIKTHGGSMTANLFTYRSVFDKVGLFNENLMSYGDLDWGSLATKAGYRIDYVEDVIVYHPPRTFRELVIKEQRLGGGAIHFYKKHRSNWMNVLKFVYKLRPRTGALRNILSSSKRYTIRDIIAIPLLRYYLHVKRNFETLRVQFGKKPNRL
jgi:GT2 family glycosyltransferase